eukprot:3148434-Amphidinium_carterae.1
MTLQELKDQVRVAEEERFNVHKPGYYATIPTSLLQLYRDRITHMFDNKKQHILRKYKLDDKQQQNGQKENIEKNLTDRQR